MNNPNITERFFRAIGWTENKEGAHPWQSPCGRGKYWLPNITQSWPDFKKYVIPVMHEKSYDLEIFFNQDGYTYATLTPTKKGLQIEEVEKHSLEGLEAAVEAAVEVLEGENE